MITKTVPISTRIVISNAMKRSIRFIGKKVIDRGKRSNALSEVKSVENISKIL